MNQVIKLAEICDRDAVAIGELYAKARGSIVDSLRCSLECGGRLISKKKSLPHGQWLPWLEANAAVLGFETRATAAKLMKLANVTPALHLVGDLDEATAVKVSRQLWGHTDNVRGTQGTGENEWYTPEDFVEAARSVLGEIDLDPASSPIAQRVVQAKNFFTEEDNGLVREWNGKVWLNPPYAQPFIAQFADKMVEELDSGRVSEAVMLTHNYSDTSWFQKLAERCSAICFTRGRIRFVSPEGELAAPTQGQTFFYFGSGSEQFTRVFADIGFIAEIIG